MIFFLGLKNGNVASAVALLPLLLGIVIWKISLSPTRHIDSCRTNVWQKVINELDCDVWGTVSGFFLHKTGRQFPGEKVRRKGILHTKKEDITPSFAATFSLGSMYAELAALCPATANILHAMCTTTLQEKRMTKQGKVKKDMVSVAYTPIHDRDLLCHVTRQL